MTARQLIIKSDKGTTVVEQTDEPSMHAAVMAYWDELVRAGHVLTESTKTSRAVCSRCGLAFRWYYVDKKATMHSDFAIGEQCIGAQLNLHGGE